MEMGLAGNGEWRMGNGRTYRWPWDCIPERGHRPQTIRLQTLDGMDFMYHSGVSPFLRSGKGGKRRGQSAECSSCRMTQKGKSVTLTLYSSPGRAIPQPSARRAVKLKNPRAPKGQSILRTVPFTTLLHNLPPAGGHNPRGAAPSTLTPKACPMPVALSFSVSMDYNKVVKFIRKMGKGACGTILPRAFSLICFIFPCSGRRLFFFLISRRIFYVQCGSTSCKRKMCRR